MIRPDVKEALKISVAIPDAGDVSFDLEDHRRLARWIAEQERNQLISWAYGLALDAKIPLTIGTGDGRRFRMDVVRTLLSAGWLVEPLEHPGYDWESNADFRAKLAEKLSAFAPVEPIYHRFDWAPYFFVCSQNEDKCPLWLAAAREIVKPSPATMADVCFGRPSMAGLVD